jgi:hypothetical protein
MSTAALADAGRGGAGHGGALLAAHAPCGHADSGELTQCTLAPLQARVQAYVLRGDPSALSDVDAAHEWGVHAELAALPGAGLTGGDRGDAVGGAVGGTGAVDRAGPAAAGLGAERRLAIYHHAYRARLLETLRDSFGHTWRYLGDEWFDLLAGHFIEQHPSQQRNLRWYGAAWPQWLAGEIGAGPMSALLTPTLDDAALDASEQCGHSAEPAARAPGDQAEQIEQALREQVGTHAEVAELAHLDWVLRRAFDAADAPTLGLAELATIAPEAWDALVLRAQPSCSLVRMQFNTLALWHALDQDQDVPPAQRLAQAVDVLVWRVGDQPHFRSLAPPEAVAVKALLQGQTFGALCALLANDLDAASAEAKGASGHGQIAHADAGAHAVSRAAAGSHPPTDAGAPAPVGQQAACAAAHMLRRWIDDGLLACLACATQSGPHP